MKLLAKLGSILDSANNFLASLCAILVAVLMLLTCYTTLMRYIFHRPLVWGIQVMEYMLFILPFLGAAWLLQKRGHVRVDMVLSRLSLKAQTVINIVTSSIGAVVCLVISWYGTAVAWENFQEGICEMKVLVVPSFILLAFIPFGCIFLSLEFLREGYNYLMSLRTSSEKD